MGRMPDLVVSRPETRPTHMDRRRLRGNGPFNFPSRSTAIGQRWCGRLLYGRSNPPMSDISSESDERDPQVCAIDRQPTKNPRLFR